MTTPADLHLPTRESPYFGKRVVVFGASGFIGQWVSRRLVRQGADSWLIVRNRSSADSIFEMHDIQSRVLELDLLDRPSLRSRLREIRPSIVFNLAGYGVDHGECDQQIAYRINADLVAAICESLVEMRDNTGLGQAIVHAGSALEYGQVAGNLAEDAEANPTTLYGQSKLAGTVSLARCCKRFGVRGITVRLFTVYGPGEHPGRLLPSLLEAAKTRRPVPLTSGAQQRDFTYVEDVADGLLRLGLAACEPGMIINLARGRLTPVREFIEIAARELKIPRELLLFGAIPTRYEEMRHDSVTIDRLREFAAWSPPTGIPAGIRRTFEFQTLHKAV